MYGCDGHTPQPALRQHDPVLLADLVLTSPICSGACMLCGVCMLSWHSITSQLLMCHHGALKPVCLHVCMLVLLLPIAPHPVRNTSRMLPHRRLSAATTPPLHHHQLQQRR
jgi:hypothetical protein